MEGNHLHFIDEKTEAPQGFRPGKTGVGRTSRKSNQGLNFNHRKSSLGLQLRSRDIGWRRHLLGWEPQAEESESKKTDPGPHHLSGPLLPDYKTLSRRRPRSSGEVSVESWERTEPDKGARDEHLLTGVSVQTPCGTPVGSMQACSLYPCS